MSMKQGTGNRERGTGVLGWLAALLLAATVAGCMSIGGPKEPVTIYAPQVRVTPDPAWPMADWQLSIGLPTASRMVDSVRIAVRPVPGELQVYKGAIWAKGPDEQLQDALDRKSTRLNSSH